MPVGKNNEMRSGGSAGARAGRGQQLADAYDNFGALVWLAANPAVGATGATAVTEDVFMTLWRGPERYDERIPPGRWLMDLAYERAASWKQQHGASGPASAGTLLSSPRCDEEIRVVLRALTSEQRASLILAKAGMSTRQIAADLGIEPATVASRMRDGLRAIVADPRCRPGQGSRLRIRIGPCHG